MLASNHCTLTARFSIDLNSEISMPVLSHTDVKQGSPLSPHSLDGLHRSRLHCCSNEGPSLQDSRVVPDLGYADDFVLMATIATGLQRGLDAVAMFCTGAGTSMGMIIRGDQGAFVIAFEYLYPVHFHWTINGS